MTDNDQVALDAVERVLDMTNVCDWPLVHQVVREDVEKGALSKEFESAYRELVDRKLKEAAQTLRSALE